MILTRSIPYSVLALSAFALIGCASPSYELATYNADPESEAQLSETERARVEVLAVMDNFPTQPEFLIRVTNLDNRTYALHPDDITIRVNGQIHPSRSFSNLREEVERSAEAQRLSVLRDNELGPDADYTTLSSRGNIQDSASFSDEMGVAYRPHETGRAWISQQHQLERIERFESIELARLQSSVLHSTDLNPNTSTQGRVVCEAAKVSGDPLDVQVEVEFANEVHSFAFTLMPSETGRVQSLLTSVWPLSD